MEKCLIEKNYLERDNFNSKKKLDATGEEQQKQILLPSEILIEVLQFFSRNKLDSLQMVNKTFNSVIHNYFRAYPLRVMAAALLEQDGSCLVVDEEGKHSTYSSFETLLEIKKKQNVFLSTLTFTAKEKIMQLIKPLNFALPQFFSYGDNKELPVQLAINGRSVDEFRGRTQVFYMFYSWAIEIFWPSTLLESSSLCSDSLIKWLQFNNTCPKDCLPKRFKANTYAIAQDPAEFEQDMFNYFESGLANTPFEIIIGSWGNSIVIRTELADNPDYEEAVWVLRCGSFEKDWQPWWTVYENAKNLCDWITLISLADETKTRTLRFCKLEDMI
uniref:F-box domain-containing protein n=1 Tax=Ditylenchus dipsaci TaxID=166011 RepID=A0A915DLE1_9BILA